VPLADDQKDHHDPLATFQIDRSHTRRAADSQVGNQALLATGNHDGFPMDHVLQQGRQMGLRFMGRYEFHGSKQPSRLTKSTNFSPKVKFAKHQILSFRAFPEFPASSRPILRKWAGIL
jgi:hypothetical protein